MVRNSLIAAVVLVLAGIGSAHSQTAGQYEGVKLVRLDDGMSEAVYAYASAEGGILQQIDAEGIVFAERDPALVWGCVAGELVVVYKFDTGLIGENNTLSVRTRFDGETASPTQFWPKAGSENNAEELGLALLTGADSIDAEENSFFSSMFDAMTIAAMAPPESTGEFLAAAVHAQRVTIRVTDQMDGETHTDTFVLAGLAEALKSVKQACQP